MHLSNGFLVLSSSQGKWTGGALLRGEGKEKETEERKRKEEGRGREAAKKRVLEKGIDFFSSVFQASHFQFI